MTQYDYMPNSEDKNDQKTQDKSAIVSQNNSLVHDEKNALQELDCGTADVGLADTAFEDELLHFPEPEAHRVTEPQSTKITRKIFQSGSSRTFHITVPKFMLDRMGLGAGSSIALVQDKDWTKITLIKLEIPDPDDENYKKKQLVERLEKGRKKLEVRDG